MVTAYRRKRMMEGLIRGDTDMTEKIDDMGRRAEKAKQRAILGTVYSLGNLREYWSFAIAGHVSGNALAFRQPCSAAYEPPA